MLNLKPRLAPDAIPLTRCAARAASVCGKPFAGHFAARQCSDHSREEAIRARGRVSSQRIRDERREPLPQSKCASCKKKRWTPALDKKYVLRRLPGALYRSNRVRNKAAAQADASGLARRPLSAGSMSANGQMRPAASSKPNGRTASRYRFKSQETFAVLNC